MCLVRDIEISMCSNSESECSLRKGKQLGLLHLSRVKGTQQNLWELFTLICVDSLRPQLGETNIYRLFFLCNIPANGEIPDNEYTQGTCDQKVQEKAADPSDATTALST